MKKRILAVFCAAVLALGLLTAAAAAADEVYFLALNDTLAPLTADLMPIRINGVVYIPCTVFDQRVTGINLGVYYGQDKTLGTITLYSKQKTLMFDINAGSAYDPQSESVYPSRGAVVRNGRTYLPAYAVCQYFELKYSNLSTGYGPLFRIKSETVWLSDDVFISSAASLMSLRLSEYQQSQTSATSSSPSGSSSPTPSSLPSDGETTDKSGVRVYLAMRVDSGEQLQEILDVLSGQSVQILFFMRPSDLAEQDDLVRRIVGSGHQLGLLVEGGTLGELEQQLEEGNRLLEQIVRSRTYTVLVDGTESQRSQLSREGWLCWEDNVDGLTRGRGSTSLVNDIMEETDDVKSLARILMDDTGSVVPTLSKLLRRLKAEHYVIRLAVETEC